MKKLLRVAAIAKKDDSVNRFLEKIEKKSVACTISDCYYAGEGA